MLQDLSDLVAGVLNVVWTPSDDRPRRARLAAAGVIVAGTIVIAVVLVFLAVLAHAY